MSPTALSAIPGRAGSRAPSACRTARRRPDHQTEQQQVADRIGQVRQRSRSCSPPVDVTMPWKAKAATHRAAPRPAMTPSSQLGSREPPHLAAHEEHDCDVGERIEAQDRSTSASEGVGAAPPSDSTVSTRSPMRQASSATPRESATARPARGRSPRAMQRRARDELDAHHEPAVEKQRIRPGVTQEHRDQVADEEHAEQAVEKPEWPSGVPRPGGELRRVSAANAVISRCSTSRRRDGTTGYA